MPVMSDQAQDRKDSLIWFWKTNENQKASTGKYCSVAPIF